MKSIDLILPVYNEESRLARSLPRLHHFISARIQFSWQITIVNNGSTDRTQQVAEDFNRKLPRVRVLRIPQAGRGRALKQAWSQSEADILSYMDVDLATDLSAFPELISPIACGEADVAIGSRLLKDSRTSRSWRREIISRSYVRLARLSCGLHCSDSQCGFKAISSAAAADLLPHVQDTGWFFDTELLIRAERRGYRISEIPVTWNEDLETRVRIFRTAWRDICGLWRMRRGRTSEPPRPESRHSSCCPARRA